MSAKSSFGSTFSLYGGIAPLVERTNVENASYESGSGANTLPLLVATEPCPWVPWHCQQPCFMNAAFPFSADAASALP